MRRFALLSLAVLVALIVPPSAGAFVTGFDPSGVADETPPSTSTPNGTAAPAGRVEIEHRGDRLELRPRDDQRVRGTTTLPAGTRLVVRLRSAGNTTPRFVEADTVVVTDAGRFTAVFDLSNVRAFEGSGAVSVTVRYDGRTVETTTAFLVHPVEDTETPTPSATERRGVTPTDGSQTAERTPTRSPTATPPSSTGGVSLGFGLALGVAAFALVGLASRR